MSRIGTTAATTTGGRHGRRALRRVAANCGGCRQACPAGEPTCCDGLCVDLDRDAMHCGRCGKRCGVGLPCKDGSCPGECPPDKECGLDQCCRDGETCAGAMDGIGGRVCCPADRVEAHGSCCPTDRQMCGTPDYRECCPDYAPKCCGVSCYPTDYLCCENGGGCPAGHTCCLSQKGRMGMDCCATGERCIPDDHILSPYCAN